MIALTRNVMDQYDHYDSKGQMQPISSKEELPIDHDIKFARNVLNQLPVKFPAFVAPSNEI